MRKRVFVAAAVVVAATAAMVWMGRPVTGHEKEMVLDLGNKVTLKLVQIPAGKFIMGSPEKEKGHKNDELQHEVVISKPFYLGVTDVSVDQFGAFVKDSGYQTEAEKAGWSQGFEIVFGTLKLKDVEGCSWRNPGFPQMGDYPVVQVSWNDAAAFCTWLSKRSGKTVVLPTEGQWEYACRAGAKTAYPWGDNPDDGVGWDNCADQSLKKTLSNTPPNVVFFNWDDGYAFTSPGGSFKCNMFGLYDMNGNVLQWCQDRFADYQEGVAINPTGADSGSYRVVRGGCWFNPPAFCRSASRIPLEESHRFGDLGFRVAVVAGGH